MPPGIACEPPPNSVVWVGVHAGSPVALLILVGSDGPQGMALLDVSVALPEDRIFGAAEFLEFFRFSVCIILRL